MTPEEIENLVKSSRKKGDFDEDWKKEEVIANPAHEPDPVDDLPPID